MDNNNILLRGCNLKNTDWIIGIVVYNGHNSKIMKNSVRTKEKKSLLEEKMNHYIILIFCFLLIFCGTSALLYIVWLNVIGDNQIYLNLKLNLFTTFFIRLGNWILIFGNFVPISLMVTVETVKFL